MAPERTGYQKRVGLLLEEHKPMDEQSRDPGCLRAVLRGKLRMSLATRLS